MRYFLLIKVISLENSFGKSALVPLYGLTWSRYSLCRGRRLCPSIWRQNRQASSMGCASKKSKTPKHLFLPKSTFCPTTWFGVDSWWKFGIFSVKNPSKTFFYGHFLRSEKIPEVFENSGIFFEKPGFFSKNREKKIPETDFFHYFMHNLRFGTPGAHICRPLFPKLPQNYSKSLLIKMR